MTYVNPNRDYEETFLEPTEFDEEPIEDSQEDDETIDAVYTCVLKAYLKGIKFRSSYAREHAHTIAFAASTGLITMLMGDLMLPEWKPTIDGMRFVQALSQGENNNESSDD